MRGIHSRAKCIYLAIPPGIMRGGEGERKKRIRANDGNKISVRIRKNEKKRKERGREITRKNAIIFIDRVAC